VQIFDPGGEAK